ncbi:MAG: IclR family transcriptional regulator C-terminal domain-containing protein, partial [Lautropia sp.]
GRIMLHRVHSSHALRDHGLPGDVTPLDRGAGGHVLRAFLHGQARDRAIRERLLAVTTGEIESGMLGMASPVFDRAGGCVGAVALTGPAQRFTPEAIRQWEPPLLRAAQGVTVQLGGNGRLFEAALASHRD